MGENIEMRGSGCAGDASGVVAEVAGLTRRRFVQIVGLGALAAVSGAAVGCSSASPAAKDGSGNVQAQEESFDVVIVGGGGSGLAAAVTAAEQGKKRGALLEKLAHARRHLRAQPLGDHRPGRGDGRILRRRRSCSSTGWSRPRARATPGSCGR